MFSEFHSTKSQLHHAGFLYLSTCPLKCERMQVRIEEMLITKDKKPCGKYLISQHTLISETKPTRTYSLSIYIRVSCICRYHDITRAPGIFTKY